MSRHLPVLIVGAGPAGLMMACELARRGVSFRIIDQKAQPTSGSNATWIQTRTLEMLDAMGLANAFLKAGNRCDAINFYAKGKCLVTVPLSSIDSCYPYTLMLAQHDTERLLTKKLEESDVHVERSLELVDIKQTSQGVVSSIRDESGDVHEIASSWVVACDGANSVVRDKCQIAFPGKNIPEQFMVADARMGSFLPNNELHVFFDKGDIDPDKGTVFSAFPLGSNQYRLSANLYFRHARKFYTEHEVQELVAERAYGNYVVEDVSWISPFWIHSKIADRMQQGSIFLVGDAAHIHSPASGQGMNLGMQDAYNLAWKLALVVKGKAKSSLLDSYQQERYPIIKKIVDQAESITNTALFDKEFITKLRAFSKELKKPKAAKAMDMALTQLDILYEDSPIIHYDAVSVEDAPRPGMRAPDVMIDDAKHLYACLRNTAHNILLFSGLKPDKNTLSDLVELEKKITQAFSGLVKTHIVIHDALNESEHVIADKNALVHKAYHVKKPTLYVLRPDTYIGYRAESLDFTAVEHFLRQYLL